MGQKVHIEPAVGHIGGHLMPVWLNWLLLDKPVARKHGPMKQWTIPARIAHGCVRWLRTPQPRGGVTSDDADIRRMTADLDAIRARFPEHA